MAGKMTSHGHLADERGPRGDAFVNLHQIVNVRSVLDVDFPADYEYVFNFAIGLVLFELSAYEVWGFPLKTRGPTRINTLRHVFCFRSGTEAFQI